MFTSSHFRKSIGSGELLQHAPNVSGYSVASHKLDHPPDEWPVMIRADACGMSLNRFSSSGMSSVMSALPYGPFTSESMNNVWPLGLSGSSMIQNVLCAMSSAAEPLGRCARRFDLNIAIVWSPP